MGASPSSLSEPQRIIQVARTGAGFPPSSSSAFMRVGDPMFMQPAPTVPSSSSSPSAHTHGIRALRHSRASTSSVYAQNPPPTPTLPPGESSAPIPMHKSAEKEKRSGRKPASSAAASTTPGSYATPAASPPASPPSQAAAAAAAALLEAAASPSPSPSPSPAQRKSVKRAMEESGYVPRSSTRAAAKAMKLELDAQRAIRGEEPEEPEKERENENEKEEDTSGAYGEGGVGGIVGGEEGDYQVIFEEPMNEDGYRWRKYGQKIMKGSPFPRNYYKCTTIGCYAKKLVETVMKGGREMTMASYRGTHTHPPPPKRVVKPEGESQAEESQGGEHHEGESQGTEGESQAQLSQEPKRPEGEEEQKYETDYGGAYEISKVKDENGDGETAGEGEAEEVKEQTKEETHDGEMETQGEQQENQNQFQFNPPMN